MSPFVLEARRRGRARSRSTAKDLSKEGELMPVVAWIVFLAAALLEVAGDAVIRSGLRGGSVLLIAGGFVALGCYGIVVNTVRWDFSRLLGAYVSVFALVSVLFGRIVFHETVASSTWIGVAIILVGGLVVQLGPLFE
jgi:small multidrug resistance family-3 protein